MNRCLFKEVSYLNPSGLNLFVKANALSYNIKEIKSLNSCLAENNWAYSLLFYNRSKRDNLQKKGWK
jgi:hypothetical protein